MIERTTAGTKSVTLALTLVLFGAIAFEGQAHADQVLAETGVFVGDPTAQYSLNVSSAGSLSVYLTDYHWPSPLADLTVEIASPTKILGQMKGAGHETLSLSGPGTYYAYVMGDASGPLNIGAYGLKADFQPLSDTPSTVPLPGSVSLLLGGIAALLWSVRRKSAPAPTAA